MELLAPPGDVWSFLTEPRRFADWWPNVAAVEPDRLGLAAGARWQVRRAQATLVRRRAAADTLIVLAAEAEQLWRFQLVRERLDVELRLEPARGRHTRAELAVEGPLLMGFSRRLPQQALARLHALCQTSVLP